MPDAVPELSCGISRRDKKDNSTIPAGSHGREVKREEDRRGRMGGRDDFRVDRKAPAESVRARVAHAIFTSNFVPAYEPVLP